MSAIIVAPAAQASATETYRFSVSGHGGSLTYWMIPGPSTATVAPSSEYKQPHIGATKTITGIRYLCGINGTGSGGSQQVTYTVRINGVDTAATIVISHLGAGVTAQYQAVGGSITVADGDVLSVRMNIVATVSSASLIQLAILLS